MTAEEAKKYVSFCIKNGVQWDEEELLRMSDRELIKFAESEMDRGDAHANDNENFEGFFGQQNEFLDS